MVSSRTLTDGGRALAFLLLYALVASTLDRFGPYLRVAGALGISIAVFAAIDVLPALVRGERPSFTTDSRLYSVRGLILLMLIVLVTSLAVTWLRRTTALSEFVVSVTGFVVGVAVVLGPVVGYYWLRSVTDRPAT